MNNKQSNDAEVIIKFQQLNERLSKFDMHIKPWGKLAVVKNSDPHNGYVLNNVTDIKVIAGFVQGLECKAT